VWLIQIRNTEQDCSCRRLRPPITPTIASCRVELFKTVIFDFDGVPTIGQAFADEIFRVFANAHPQIMLVTARANSEREANDCDGEIRPS
jgi:hypothetical protein